MSLAFAIAIALAIFATAAATVALVFAIRERARSRRFREALKKVAQRRVRDRAQQVAALEHKATHDELTELPNRALLYDRLEVAIASARRSRKTMALLVLDLDRFKEINDTLGHGQGDLVLQSIGPRVRGAIRASDTVARLGGDEFAVLLPDVGDESAALMVARKVGKAIEEPLLLEGQILNIGASVGVALCPEHGEDPDALLKHGDIAMYVAKRTAVGCVLYAPEQDQGSRRRLALSAQLKGGIEAGQLFLVYQPKVELKTGRMTGVEALVRWNHPLLGVLPPDQFVPLAEKTGQIQALTFWVLGEALRQRAAWAAAGLELSVAVNLSARSLHDPELPARVTDLLAAHGTPPGALVLEITESCIMADPARAETVLALLRGLGVRLSIDDFGTGYSSLAYLSRLPVSEIKIDRSFVTGADAKQGSCDEVIVRSTIDLGHNLGLEVVAEGVEGEPTLERLIAEGCDQAQGYLVARPIPPDAVAKLIADPPPAVKRLRRAADRRSGASGRAKALPA